MDEKDQSRRLLRSTAAVALPTVLSRVLGYVRDFLQAYYLGTGRGGDAFTIAYTIPNLFRRLTGEGALTAAFVPVFTGLKREKKREDLWKFANIFFFDLTFFTALLAVLGVALAPWLVKVIAYGFRGVEGKWDLTISLTRLMFPYIFFVSLAALAMGILNAFRRFFVPAFTPVLFNLAVISVAALFAGRAAEPAYVFAAGVIAGGVLQIGFQLPYLRKEGMHFQAGLSFRDPDVRKVVRLLGPGVFGAGLYQINFALSRMLASGLEEGSVSSLYYSSRVEELTLGLFSIALSVALLPSLSERAAAGDMVGLKKMLTFSLRLVFLVSLPAAAGLLVLNTPIIRVLFERGLFDARSTTLSAVCLLYFALGLPFVSGVKILVVAYYSLQDTRTPVLIGAASMALSLGLSVAFMGPLRVGGLALAMSIAQAANFLALLVFLEKKAGGVAWRAVGLSAGKSLAASAAMAGAVWVFMRRAGFAGAGFPARVGLLAAAIALGLGVYILLIRLMGHEDLRDLKEIFSRKMRAGEG